MAVVVTLLCCICATNNYGACFNPAVGVTLTLNSMFYFGKASYLHHYAYAYTLGPALGGLCAGLFHLLHREAHKPEKKTDFEQEGMSSLLA